MRKILLIISLSILPLTCFGASGNCEWLPYSTMGTAAGGAAASSNGGLLLSTASSSSTSGGLFCDWVNVDEKEKVKFIVYNNDVLIEDISKGNLTCNAALILANRVKLQPHEVAEQFVKPLEKQDFIDKVEVAGPGFINIFLTDDAFLNVVKEIRESLGDLDVLEGRGPPCISAFISLGFNSWAFFPNDLKPVVFINLVRFALDWGSLVATAFFAKASVANFVFLSTVSNWFSLMPVKAASKSAFDPMVTWFPSGL